MPEPREAAPPPTRPAAGGAPAASPPVRSRGFGAAFKALVGRKLNELRGRRWEHVREQAEQGRRGAQRAMEAEAARRAAGEMARRIERQTGHRPAEATIRRNAQQDRTPRGADQTRIDRQSRIDTAGGIDQFARQVGANPRAVPQWRDAGGSLVGDGVRVSADVEGILWADGEPYPRAMTVSITISDPDVADEIRAAHAAYDLESVGEMLGPAITAQTDWAGDAERRYEVEVITDITVI
ncbi:hypothetical protein BKG60_03900 [Mycobacterium syngnathidarum]|nr:hypothetical protein BKG60_03900 [Mycobacterium syngnathidarum]